MKERRCLKCDGIMDEGEPEAGSKRMKWCDECNWKAHQEAERAKAQEWTGRAFAAFVGCQAYGITPPEFPLHYNAVILFTMAGRNEEISEACEKFVGEVIPMMQKIDAQRKQA